MTRILPLQGLTMMPYKLLITSSGVGSRLGSATTHTNKALVPVGGKPAISHIITPYPKELDVVVTLGHKADLVRAFLRSSYPDRQITFVDVPVYQGPGSSLGYSLHCAREHLQCPFIFHANDTIIHQRGKPIGVFPQSISANIALTGPNKNSLQYRTVQVHDSRLMHVIEKGHRNNNPALIGVLWIKDYRHFWQCLERLLSNDTCDQTLAESHIINAMAAPFFIERIPDWFDVGNPEGLREARANIVQEEDIL